MNQCLLGMLFMGLVWAFLVFASWVMFNFGALYRTIMKEPIRLAAYLTLFLALAIAIVGAMRVGAFPYNLVEAFYANLATELFSIAITILIIDRLNQVRLGSLEKARIIEQMASHSNDFALDAVTLVTIRGWLADGSLKRQRFVKGNLEYADLEGASLEGADFSYANLTSANLRGANLKDAKLFSIFARSANVIQADLSGADLRYASLSNANLSLSDLSGSDMNEVYLVESILLGTNFVNVQHLDQVTLTDSIYNQDTKWPDGFDPSSKGALFFHHDSTFGPFLVYGWLRAQMEGKPYTEKITTAIPAVETTWNYDGPTITSH